MKLVPESGPPTRKRSVPVDTPAKILDRARRWVLDLFNDHGDSRLVWHNFAQTNILVSHCSRLTVEESLTEEDLSALYFSAWFAFSGWLFDPHDPVSASRQLVSQFLHAEKQPDTLIKRVHHLIGVASLEDRPVDLTGQIIWDAAVAVQYGNESQDQQVLRKSESEQLRHQTWADADWRQKEIHQIRQLQCYTLIGKAEIEPALANHLQLLEKRVQKEQSRSRTPVSKKPVNNAAIQTYFRSNYRNHIHLSAIADRKAQMLISVNAILISVLISILSYSNLAETRTPLLIPITLFLVLGLASLIFSVISARPSVTAHPLQQLSDRERRSNLIFFGHFVQLDVTAYLEDMRALFQDDEALFQAMHRDIYFLGKVLDRKYRLLHLAYNLFLFEFIGAVVSFLIVQYVWL
ncbi:MAG: hypothetical protein IPJ06_01320 [Saprospiraceae bacterium]|nr:hypothetical protein [Saprospiraceae bacterium]